MEEKQKEEGDNADDECSSLFSQLLSKTMQVGIKNLKKALKIC